MLQPFRAAAALAAFVLPVCSLSAQVQVRWFDAFDGPAHGNENAAGLAVDLSGNVYVVARETGLSQQAKLLKYAPDGALLWTRDIVDGPEAVTALALDPADGDVVVVGAAPLVSPAGEDAIVVRFAPDGTRRWFRRWNGPDSRTDIAESVVVGRSGTVYAAVSTERADFDVDYAVLAYRSDGTPIWASVLPETHTAAGTPGPIVIDSGGNLIVTGYGGARYPSDAVVLKLDSAGNLVWYRTYDGPGADFDAAYDVATDSHRNVYICGLVSMSSSSQPDYAGFLAKYDPQGNLLWDRLVDDLGVGTDSLDALEVDYQDHAVVAGRRWDAATQYMGWLARYDPQGNLGWQRTWVGDDQHQELWTALDVDDAGGIAVAGGEFRALDYPIYESDAEVRRYDKEGNQRWAHAGLFAVPNSDYATAVAFGPNGAVAYAGVTTASPGAQYDVLVALLSDQAVPFCFGDGSAAACPCANASAPGDQVGCQNSLLQGAELVDAGAAGLTDDTLALTASALPGSIAVFVQSALTSNGGQGSPFGDGVACLGGIPFRLAAETVAGGSATYPGAGDPSISVRGGVISPGVRHYQVWYRDNASFCTGATFNLTNGLSISWTP